MAPDDAQDPSEGAATRGPANAGERPQDPIVGRLRPDPAQPPEPTLAMSGFLGDSDRPGFRRLYFTRDLDYYAEFRADDVVDMNAIPAEQSPFRGEEATRLTLRRDATVEYTRTRTARPLDEFDLDVRLARSGGRFEKPKFISVGPPDSCFDCPATPQTCGGETCPGAFTCGHDTCGATCVGSCPGDTCPGDRLCAPVR